MTEHVAAYLDKRGEDPNGYTLHRVTTYADDGYAINGTAIRVLYSAGAKVGAINYGGDWDWMDALSAQEVAEKHYALGDAD